MADLVERLRERAASIRRLRRQTPVDIRDAELDEAAAAALEAEASEGERRGLERAAEVAETWRRVDPASRRTIADHFAVSEEDMLVAVATADGIARAIRALIPEAPAREGE